jgi:hypothetical protein
MTPRGLHELVCRAIYSGGPSGSGTQDFVFTILNAQACSRSSLLIHFGSTIHRAPGSGKVLDAAQVPGEIHVLVKLFPSTPPPYSFSVTAGNASKVCM